MLQQPREVRIALEAKKFRLRCSDTIVAAVRASEVHQGSLDDPHREIVRVLAELQHPKVDQQLANVQTSLEDSQRSDVRFALQNVINREQNNLIVDATVFCDVERRAGHFSFIQAGIDDVRVGLRTQHLRFEDSVGASVDAYRVEL